MKHFAARDPRVMIIFAAAAARLIDRQTTTSLRRRSSIVDTDTYNTHNAHFGLMSLESGIGR